MPTQYQATVHRLRERRRERGRRLTAGFANPALVLPFGESFDASASPLTLSDVQGPAVFFMDIVLFLQGYTTPTLKMHGGAGGPGIEFQIVDPGVYEARDSEGNVLVSEDITDEIPPDGGHFLSAYADPSNNLIAFGIDRGSNAVGFGTAPFSQWGDLNATWSWDHSTALSVKSAEIHPGVVPPGV